MTDTDAAQASRPTLEPQVRAWLRLEGFAAMLAGVAIYFRLGGDWIWLVPAILAVDVSMVGYLRGPVIGASVYNLAHQWATGIAVLAFGMAVAMPSVAMLGGVLIAHVGMDRAMGYGLKLRTGFQDTHMGRIGKRANASTPA